MTLMPGMVDGHAHITCINAARLALLLAIGYL